MLGLNFLVSNQIDLAIEELTQGGAVDSRRARDRPDPRQPVPREGTGRPGHPGPPGAAAAAEAQAARARLRAALPRPRLQARRLRRPRARGVQRGAAARPARTSTRCVNLEKLHEEQHQWQEALRDPPAAGAARPASRAAAPPARSWRSSRTSSGLQALSAGRPRRGGARDFEAAIDLDAARGPGLPAPRRRAASRRATGGGRPRSGSGSSTWPPSAPTWRSTGSQPLYAALGDAGAVSRRSAGGSSPPTPQDWRGRAGAGAAPGRRRARPPRRSTCSSRRSRTTRTR